MASEGNGRPWAPVPIGKLLTAIIDYRGKTPPKSPFGIPCLSAANVKGGKIDLSHVTYVSDETYKRWTTRGFPEPGDVLITTEAPVGEVASFPGDRTYLMTRRIMALRGKPGQLDNGFLKYALLSPTNRDRLLTATRGTTVPRVLKTDITGLPIPLPPLAEQKAIAHILGTLDDKIELNRQMNETLEAMARAMFKSWFVDFDPVRAKMDGRQPEGMDAATAKLFPDGFEESSIGKIPAGWKVKTLNELTALVIGGDWGKDSPVDDCTEPAFCIRGADIPDLQAGGLGKMPLRYLKANSLDKRSLKLGDLAFEISGGSPTQSTGRPVLVTGGLLSRARHPIICSNFCRLIRLSSECSPIFLYLLMRHLYDADEFLQFENGTTGIKNFAFTIFSERFPLVVPPPEAQSALDRVVQPLLEKRNQNGSHTASLATLRDALLPKLLSGEIRV